MKIQVTSENIRIGRMYRHGKCSPTSCPVALALIDAGINGAYVAGTYIHFRNKEIPLPSKARNFIANFDCGFPVKPFEFELKDKDLNFLKRNKNEIR